VQTIRATVIGAGMYSTELSGSTITYENISFPLKNIPIIRLSKREELLPPTEFAEVVRQRLAWYLDEHGQSIAALSIAGEHNISYSDLEQYAQRFALALAPLGNAGLPQIVLIEHDMAKALGQMLLLMLKSRQLVCIDSVSTSQGDYIDIGSPLMSGRVLPVVIKTLVFN
jgi:ethanolamine utilization protein EutA